MGMSAGSFNTREFFHGARRRRCGRCKLGFLVLGFALPARCWPWSALAGGAALALAGSRVLVQVPGLLAERWFFFAQARHPQNLYYQVVS